MVEGHRYGHGPGPVGLQGRRRVLLPGGLVIDPPGRAGEVLGPTPDHPFQGPELDLCRLVDDPRRIADRDPSLLHRQPHRRSGGTVFGQHPGGVGHCSPAHPQQLGRFPLGERTVQICAISLAGPSGGRRRRELVGDDGPPAFVQMPPQVVPGEDIPQGVGVITQVFKPALNTGLGAGRVTVPAIDHLAPPDGDGVHQPVLPDAGHQPGEVLRRHVGKYPCKVADGVLHLHIHSPPASPGDRHSTQGPGVFTFTPAPVSSLVGWNGLRHPPARTMSHKSVNPIPDLPGQGRPRPETAHPAMPAHRQEYRGAPGSPETRSRGLTAVTGTSRPTGWDRGQAVPHPSRIAIDEWKPDSSSRGPALRSPGCHPPPLIVASGNGTAAIRQPRLSETLGVRYSRNATGGKSSNTVAATNIGDGSERPVHLTSG